MKQSGDTMNAAEPTMDVGEMVTGLRERYGSYRRAAASTGVSYATLWRMGQGIGKPEADNVRRVEAALKGEQMQDDYGDECEGLRAEVEQLRAQRAAAEVVLKRAKASREEAWGLAEQADKRAAAAEQRAEKAEARIAETCADMEDRLDIDDNGRDCWSFGGAVGPKTVKKWLAALRGEVQP